MMYTFYLSMCINIYYLEIILTVIYSMCYIYFVIISFFYKNKLDLLKISYGSLHIPGLNNKEPKDQKIQKSQD